MNRVVMIDIKFAHAQLNVAGIMRMDMGTLEHVANLESKSKLD